MDTPGLAENEISLLKKVDTNLSLVLKGIEDLKVCMISRLQVIGVEVVKGQLVFCYGQDELRVLKPQIYHLGADSRCLHQSKLLSDSVIVDQVHT